MQQYYDFRQAYREFKNSRTGENFLILCFALLLLLGAVAAAISGILALLSYLTKRNLFSEAWNHIGRWLFVESGLPNWVWTTAGLALVTVLLMWKRVSRQLLATSVREHALDISVNEAIERERNLADELKNARESETKIIQQEASSVSTQRHKVEVVVQALKVLEQTAIATTKSFETATIQWSIIADQAHPVLRIPLEVAMDYFKSLVDGNVLRLVMFVPSNESPLPLWLFRFADTSPPNPTESHTSCYLGDDPDPIRRPRGIAGAAYLNGVPQICRYDEHTKRFDHHDYALFGTSASHESVSSGYKSILAIPLRAEWLLADDVSNKVLGVLCLVGRDSDTFAGSPILDVEAGKRDWFGMPMLRFMYALLQWRQRIQ